MKLEITWAAQRISCLTKVAGGAGYKEQLVELEVIRELKLIWKDCFHDEDEYLDFFFSRRFCADNTVVAICDDRIVGAAYLLPAEIITDIAMRPAVFGYALGIKKEYRGRGILNKMHDFIFQYCDENKTVFIVHPANKKLADYYTGTGLTSVGHMKEVCYLFNEKVKKENLVLEDISAAEYTSLRNSFFSKSGYVKWDMAAIDYAIRENRLGQGFCKKLHLQSKEYAVFGKVDKNKLLLTEVILPEGQLDDIVRQLAAYFNTSEAFVLLPEDSETGGRVIPWLMGYKAGLMQRGYCNLLLN